MQCLLSWEKIKQANNILQFREIFLPPDWTLWAPERAFAHKGVKTPKYSESTRISPSSTTMIHMRPCSFVEKDPAATVTRSGLSLARSYRRRLQSLITHLFIFPQWNCGLLLQLSSVFGGFTSWPSPLAIRDVGSVSFSLNCSWWHEM